MKFIYSLAVIAGVIAYVYTKEVLFLVGAIMFHVNAAEARIVELIEARR